MSHSKTIDLHSHTTHSDGQLTPTELVMRAQQMQVDVLAITDHDTVSGVEEARAYAANSSPRVSIVAGVEISTIWHGFDIHILGLDVDHQDQHFLQLLQQQQQTREQRAQQICDKLEQAGMPDVLKKAKSIANGAQLSRSHIARAMVSLSYVTNAQSAFKKYLGKGKRAHVKADWIDLGQAITWIHDAGGRAVIAHPQHYDMNTKWLRRLVSDFVDSHGDGIEVSHPNIAPTQRQLLLEIAQQHNLLGSAGSDFHAPSRWTELGRRLAIPDTITPVWHDWTFA